MRVKEFEVETCSRNDIKDFIETNHYSGNINGCISTYCFRLLYEDTLIGAAFFGKLAMANQWKRFGESIDDVIELRRLVCIDETPKNTESYFIGKMLKWLKQNTNHKIVVSYADAEFGHSGVIYKASNFKYLGFRKGARVIIWNNKRYHDKSLRAPKPYASKLKQALEKGEAYYKETKGKHTYTYQLKL